RAQKGRPSRPSVLEAVRNSTQWRGPLVAKLMSCLTDVPHGLHFLTARPTLRRRPRGLPRSGGSSCWSRLSPHWQGQADPGTMIATFAYGSDQSPEVAVMDETTDPTQGRSTASPSGGVASAAAPGTSSPREDETADRVDTDTWGSGAPRSTPSAPSAQGEPTAI